MRVTLPIRLCNIFVTDKLPLNPATFALAKHMEAGGDVPPIHVHRAGSGQYEVRDGRHRFLAAKLLGWKEILCNVAIPEEPAAEKPLVTNGLEGSMPPTDVTPLHKESAEGEL